MALILSRKPVPPRHVEINTNYFKVVLKLSTLRIKAAVVRPYVIWDCRCKKSLLYFKPPYDYITKLGPTSPASWHFKDPCINIQTTRTIKSGVWYFQMPFLWKIPISLFYLYISQQQCNKFLLGILHLTDSFKNLNLITKCHLECNVP